MKEQEETIKPRYRFKLKSLIIAAGYRTLREFSKEIGLSESALNQVVGGWVLPGPKGQKRISKQLGITLGELRDLL